jgi:hypothetical protein
MIVDSRSHIQWICGSLGCRLFNNPHIIAESPSHYFLWNKLGAIASYHQSYEHCYHDLAVICRTTFFSQFFFDDSVIVLYDVSEFSPAFSPRNRPLRPFDRMCIITSKSLCNLDSFFHETECWRSVTWPNCALGSGTNLLICFELSPSWGPSWSMLVFSWGLQAVGARWFNLRRESTSLPVPKKASSWDFAHRLHPIIFDQLSRISTTATWFHASSRMENHDSKTSHFKKRKHCLWSVFWNTNSFFIIWYFLNNRFLLKLYNIL